MYKASLHLPESTKMLSENELQELFDTGLIKIQKNKDLNLANYIDFKVRRLKEWPNTLRKCRGIVYGSDYKIVGRCLEKFFNIGDKRGLSFEDACVQFPQGPRVFDKLDGSMILVFFHQDKWNCSTRGSFQSEQAVSAAEMLQNTYADYVAKLNPKVSYTFEYTGPKNRVKIKYIEPKLSLLAAFVTESGDEVNIDSVDWPDRPMEFKMTLDEIKGYKSTDDAKREGFVAVWPNGHRDKLKYESYNTPAVKKNKTPSNKTPAEVAEMTLATAAYQHCRSKKDDGDAEQDFAHHKDALQTSYNTKRDDILRLYAEVKDFTMSQITTHTHITGIKQPPYYYLIYKMVNKGTAEIETELLWKIVWTEYLKDVVEKKD